MLFAMPLFKNFYLRDKARISIPSTTIVDSLPKCPQKSERLKLENQLQLYPLSSRDPNTQGRPCCLPRQCTCRQREPERKMGIEPRISAKRHWKHHDWPYKQNSKPKYRRKYLENGTWQMNCIQHTMEALYLISKKTILSLKWVNYVDLFHMYCQ